MGAFLTRRIAFLRNYNIPEPVSGGLAAVLSAGFAGFSLGATPTAIANMSSVSKRYGPAPLAFILLPLVSAFFVDLINAVLIQLFVSW